MIDLHTHSTYSDGTLTPAELVDLAKKNGVSALALCDHNTVDGLSAFLDAAREQGLEAVPGTEFSADYAGGEVHILGLFIEPEHYGAVRELLAQALERKAESNCLLIRNLAKDGICLDYDALQAAMPGGLVNRAVIAGQMVRQGYCKSVQEAFKKWLAPELGYFIPPRRLDAMEVIRFIRSVGAVSVLAHPYLNLTDEQLPCFLAKATEASLDAMETYYSKFTPEQTEKAEKLAREFGLLPSGGSDFHGENKPDIELGRGRGDLRVPPEILEALKARRRNLRNLVNI